MKTKLTINTDETIFLYRETKQHLFKWSNRETPEWIK